MATDSFKSNMKFAVWALLVQFLVQNSRSFLCSYMNNQAKSTQVITAFYKNKIRFKTNLLCLGPSSPQTEESLLLSTTNTSVEYSLLLGENKQCECESCVSCSTYEGKVESPWRSLHMPVDLRHWKECNSHPHSLKSTLWYSTNMTKCVLTIQLHKFKDQQLYQRWSLHRSLLQGWRCLGKKDLLLQEQLLCLLLLKEESHKRKMVVGFHLEAIN